MTAVLKGFFLCIFQDSLLVALAKVVWNSALNILQYRNESFSFTTQHQSENQLLEHKLLLLQSLNHHWETVVPSTVPPVIVTVFYEALCPDSRSFFTKQLLPTFEKIPHLMQINLVPYGKAKVSSLDVMILGLLCTMIFRVKQFL